MFAGLALLLVACAPPADDSACNGLGGPTELVTLARLRASATRPAAGHPWARENEAGPATVRDDVPDNGWQPPDDEEAIFALDLQPAVGRAVALAALEAGWEGAVPAVTVALLPGCGLDPTVELAWDDPTQALDLEGRCAGCLELRVRGGEDTVLEELSLEGYPPAVGSQLETGAVVHRGSGLIEGFYGQPWSWRERRDALLTLQSAGLGLYLYAPKDDPYHRDRWREPYPEDDLDRFEALAELASWAGVDLVIGISPFIDLDPDDPDDYAVLLSKLEGFAELGVGGVALLADDIEFEADVTVDGALGATHAAYANRLLTDLRPQHAGLDLWFVPTVYSDDRLATWEGAPAYLEALRDLDPSIAVMWTGPGTFAERIEAADLDVVRDLVGRDPVLWDNYWANDAWDLLSGRVHLSPYDGRAPDLAGAVGGIGANPMIQGSLSRLNAGALAAWLDEPALETAEEGRARAAAIEATLYGDQPGSSADMALLVRLMTAFDGSGLSLPGHGDLAAGVDALPADPAVVAPALLPILAGLATAASDLHHSGLGPELVDELAYPADKLRDEGQAGLWALWALRERLEGGEGSRALELAREAMDRSADSRFVFGIGVLEDLVDRVEAVPVQDAGLQPPVVLPAAPLGCVVDQPLRWEPFGGAERVEVFGLPGATVRGGSIRWLPPHAGTFEAVAVGESAAGGWAWVSVTLRCWPS